MLVIEILSNWLSLSWNLVNQTKVPGFNFSYGNVITATILINGSFTIIHMITGFSMRSGLRGGNNKNIKIDDRRKGDAK